jgi:hypothetical protein
MSMCRHVDVQAPGAEAPPSEATRIAAALAAGGAVEREAAYASIEGAVRAAPAAGGAWAQAVAFAVACTRPLIVSVLLAPAAKVGQAEWTRATLLLYEMCKLEMIAVIGEASRKDEEGVSLWTRVWMSQDNALAAIVAKEPREWTQDDAIAASANGGVWTVVWAVGGTAVCAAAGLDELEWFGHWFGHHPFTGDSPQPEDRYLRLALLCLDIVRSDTQPEGVVAGAGMTMCMMQLPAGRPSLGKVVWEAGFLDVFQACLWRYNPIERISKQNLIPSGMLSAFNSWTAGAQAAGVEVVQPLLDAGAADLAISTLSAYQMLGDPGEASVCAFWYGALWTLETILAGLDEGLLSLSLSNLLYMENPYSYKKCQ